MNLNFELQPLTWDNYLALTNYIDNSNYDLEFWSPIALMMWSFYGVKFYFHILENNKGIVFYIQHEKYHNKEWKVSTCFYNKQNLDLNLFIQTFKTDLTHLNGSDDIKYNNISEQMINDFNIDISNVHKINYVSNYIYETQVLKTFQGKKLQKKRNHLNFFLKHYSSYVQIKQISEIDDNTILEFCKKHIIEFQGKLNESEMACYEQLVITERYKDSNYKGIAIYIDGTLVALTLCYLRKNICEILIEKAIKDIRGIYQYLLSENLKINNVTQSYVDREDDNGNEMLTKSKMSYYPLSTVSRYATKS